MSHSYGNISVRAIERPALRAWLEAKQIDAWVGPEAGGWIAFTDKAVDGFDLGKACETMVAMTADLGGAAIIAAVHNADVLGILAVDKGRHVASYISYPGILAEGPPPKELKPEITGAPGMLAALGADANVEDLKRILAVSTPEQFVYPLELHAEFVRTFGLPEYTLSFGYAGAEAGALPGELAAFARAG